MYASETRPFIVRPGSPAERLMYSNDLVVMCDGPTGSGKTRPALEKAFWCATEYPGTRILLLRKAKAHSANTVMTTWETQVVPPGHSASRLRTANYKSPTYAFPNGSYVAVDGMYDGSGYNHAVMGTEWDLIFADEGTQFSSDDHGRLAGRLNRIAHDGRRIPFNQLVYTTNPDSPSHWLWQLHLAGKLRRIRSRLEDNPVFHDGTNWTPQGLKYLESISHYQGVLAKRNRDGEWISAEGVIYDEWEPSVHIIDKMPENWERWPRYSAVDFGFNDPFVWMTAVLSPRRELIIYREYVKCRKIVADHAEAMLRMMTGEPIHEAIAHDHDREDAATLAMAGITGLTPCIKPRTGIKDRTAWVAAFEPVKRMLREGRIKVLRSALAAGGGVEHALTAMGKPCGIIDEIGSYAWEEAKPGQPTKEAPAKDSNDHSCDVLRYLVWLVESQKDIDSPKADEISTAEVPYYAEDKDEDGVDDWSLG